MLQKSYGVLGFLSPLTLKTLGLRASVYILTSPFTKVFSKNCHSSLIFPICKMSSSTGPIGLESSDIVLERPAQLAKDIFKEAVESVKPINLMKKRIQIDSESVLKIHDGNGIFVDLKQYKRIFVIGFGKAVLPMAEEVMSILGTNVTRCLVNIPQGFRNSNNNKIEINRGATNNIPDEAAYLGSQKIVELVKSCQSQDLLIVLITGGGSALLPYPYAPITIQEKSSLIKILSTAGASIQELNTVRKRLSLVKGGGLLNMGNPSRIVSLILSDVLGDPLDIIASGPTIPNVDPRNLAKEIVEKYTTFRQLPESIRKLLENHQTVPKTLSKSDVTNTIIGNNSIALETAASTAKDLKLFPFIITNMLSGEASSVGEELAHVAQAISYLFQCEKSDRYIHVYSKSVINGAEKLGLDMSKITELIDRVLNQDVRDNHDGVCLLLGGETTVHVKGKGIGGRNQELALKAAIRISSSANNQHVKGNVAILSAGTDGFDGPCEAAGAVIDSSTIKNGYVDKLSPFEYLVENNSYNYFKANSSGAYHILTGHTETNVMDLVIIVALKNRRSQL